MVYIDALCIFTVPNELGTLRGRNSFAFTFWPFRNIALLLMRMFSLIVLHFVIHLPFSEKISHTPLAPHEKGKLKKSA